MAKFSFDLTYNPRDEDLDSISAILRADTENKGVEARNKEPFAIFIRDEIGKAIGGISGHMVWGWLYIERLGVPVDMRGQAIGKQLVEAAEEMAVRKNCHHAHVSTASYQVPGFYTLLGYQEYSRLPDHPTGHTFIEFMKRLAA